MGGASGRAAGPSQRMNRNATSERRRYVNAMSKIHRRPKFAAGLIERSDQELLIALPRSDSQTERRWQFPRDEVQAKESPEAAMRRVAKERLGIEVEITIGQPPVLAQLGGRSVEMRYFHCEVTSGEPSARQYAEVRWIPKAHLREYEFDEVSQPVAAWLLSTET